MKKLAFIFGLFILTSFVSIAQDKKNSTETITIKTSAACDMCKNTLEKAMAYEKGIKKAELNVASKLFTISYNPQKTNPEKIIKAINKSGYDANDSPADAKAYENLPDCCKKDSNR